MRVSSLVLLLAGFGCGGPEPSVIDPRFDELRWTSDLPLDGDLNEDGDLVVLTGRFEPLTSGDASAEVAAFVATWQDLLAVSSDQLGTADVVAGSGDASVARFDVQHEGLPVFDAYVVGEVSPPYGVTLLVTHVPTDLDVPTTPAVSSAEALATAEDLDELEDVSTGEEPRLGVFNGGLYLDEDTPSTLAWEVPLLDGDVFVDAMAGDVVWVDSQVQDIDLDLYTANHSSDMYALGGYAGAVPTAVLWITEAGSVPGTNPTAQALDAADYVTAVHDYFENTHGYTAIDGSGIIPTRVYVHFSDAGYKNAFFALNALWIGEGANELDVLGHEFTHGIVAYTARLRYAAYSGALNESYADSFSAFIDTGERWQIGENMDGGAIRYMDRPQLKNQPSHWKQRYKVPRGGACKDTTPRCDIGEFCVGGRCTSVTFANDHGGVHVNSGIPNNATWLMAADPVGQERQNPKSHIAARSIGRDKTSHLMMRTLQSYLRRSSSFGHYARSMVSACRSAARSASNNPAGLDMRDCGAVLTALYAVGIHKGPDKDQDSYRDAIDVCPDDFDPDQEDSDHDLLGDACDDLDGARVRVVTRHSHSGDSDPVHIVIDGEAMATANKIPPGGSKTRWVTVSGEVWIGVGRGSTVWESRLCGFAVNEGRYEAVYHEGFGLQTYGFNCWRTAPGIPPPDPTEPGEEPAP